MKSLFSAEGRLMQFLQKTGELILVNTLFLICCVPVITAGASATSFYYTMIKSIRRERGNPLEEFFHSMKRTLGKGSIVTAELLVWGVLLYLGKTGAAASGNRHLEAVYLGLAVVSLGVAVYIFPVLSRFEMKLADIWKLSFVMAIRFLPVTAAVLVGTAAVGWLLFFYLPIPCMLIVPGCWCLLSTFLIEKVLLAYMPKEDGEDAWYYGTDTK